VLDGFCSSLQQSRDIQKFVIQARSGAFNRIQLKPQGTVNARNDTLTPRLPTPIPCIDVKAVSCSWQGMQLLSKYIINACRQYVNIERWNWLQQQQAALQAAATCS